MQVNPLLLAVFQCIGVKFFHKKFRTGQAETVNALLHIPHHENIMFSLPDLRYRQHQLFLHKTAVLILVDENFLKLFRELPGCGSIPDPAVFLLHQNIQGEMLQIREIQQVFLPLAFPVLLHKIPGQVNQSADRHLAHLHLL